MSTDTYTENAAATELQNCQAMECAPAQQLMQSLAHWFGIEFAIIDARSGDVVSCPAEFSGCDWGAWGMICRGIAELGRPQIIADEHPLFVLAIPEVDSHGDGLVAAAVFASRSATEMMLPNMARMLGCSQDEARRWADRNYPLAAEPALRMAMRYAEGRINRERVRELERDVEDLSLHLSSTYEEISLLYRLTQNLKLSSKDDELGAMALGWLADVVPAESLAIQFTAIAKPGTVDCDGRTEPSLLAYGDCPVTCEQFERLLERLGPIELHKPLIVHGNDLAAAKGVAEGVREMLVVPLCEGQNLFGYLAAFNHCEGREFGTVEASLLSSVAAILGIHSGNIELYRQQREFLRGVVRALTSAIDAKDPYTCGHSDRVARVAVRLAEQLGCNEETLNTIYLSGLLHDIGKIGIDDNVLRKPGKLTEVEYEHIKLHSEIGYRILKDLRQLDEVLPVVLHHHEQWDGKGYPCRIAGDHIPLMARIVAVADAFDAMGSDRPYRQGMPDARLDQVLRDGAGKQWDPTVINAFFAARDEIRDIFRRDREPQRELPQWM